MDTADTLIYLILEYTDAEICSKVNNVITIKSMMVIQLTMPLKLSIDILPENRLDLNMQMIVNGYSMLVDSIGNVILSIVESRNIITDKHETIRAIS